MIHAAGENGFVPNALVIFKSESKQGNYHSDMNSENYGKWIMEKRIPNLEDQSVLMTDNPPCHNVQSKFSTDDIKKEGR